MSRPLALLLFPVFAMAACPAQAKMVCTVIVDAADGRVLLEDGDCTTLGRGVVGTTGAGCVFESAHVRRGSFAARSPDHAREPRGGGHGPGRTRLRYGLQQLAIRIRTDGRARLRAAGS